MIQGLYAITPSGLEENYLLSQTEVLLKEGVKLIQYRDKIFDKKTFQEKAKALLRLTKKYKAKLHISYFSLENDLKTHTENSRRLAFKHTNKANSISEIIYQNDERNVYGVKFDFDGSTATSTQFFLTDSSNHFFRGALYFNTQKSDSLGIIEEYLKVDVKRIIETFCWK